MCTDSVFAIGYGIKSEPSVVVLRFTFFSCSTEHLQHSSTLVPVFLQGDQQIFTQHTTSWRRVFHHNHHSHSVKKFRAIFRIQKTDPSSQEPDSDQIHPFHTITSYFSYSYFNIILHSLLSVSSIIFFRHFDDALITYSQPSYSCQPYTFLDKIFPLTLRLSD